MKSRIVAIALITIVSTPGLWTVGQEATAQALLGKAGTAAFPAGKDGINITFSSPMKDTTYSVFVQPTNTAGYSTTSACTYFNPLHKRVDGFEVQHKKCEDGVPVKLDTNVSLDWIAVDVKWRAPQRHRDTGGLSRAVDPYGTAAARFSRAAADA